MESTIKQHHKPNLLKWAIAIALVIVINLFFHYIIVTAYPVPTVDQFCPAQPATYTTAVDCVQNGGQWTNYDLAPAQITDAVKNNQQLGTCDPNFTCNNNFDHAHSVYNRNVFIILIVLSLVILSIGVFAPYEVLALGFSWAGVVSLIVASGQYWSDANNWMRVVILVVALLLLIWLSVRKFKD